MVRETRGFRCTRTHVTTMKETALKPPLRDVVEMQGRQASLGARCEVCGLEPRLLTGALSRPPHDQVDAGTRGNRSFNQDTSKGRPGHARVNLRHRHRS